MPQNKRRTILCALCGAEIEARQGPLKYCPACAVVRQRDAARKYKHKLREEKKRLQLEAERNRLETERRDAGKSKRPKKLRREALQAERDAVVRPVLEGKSLRRVAAEAKLLGLSYGQYVQLVADGGIVDWLRLRRIDIRDAFRSLPPDGKGRG